MTKRLLLGILFWINMPALFAQNASTTHVFPQIVDGRQDDGFYYVSRLWITNQNATTNCTVSVFGLGTDRLTAPTTITVVGNSWATVGTRGQDPIATGYARLDCAQPVKASLTFILLSPNGTLSGMATVLSAPVASYALLPMLLNGTSRYGIALANNNDVPLTVSFLFNPAQGGGSGLTIQVPARSQYVRFVDEIFSNVPAQGTGTFEVYANGTIGSGNFNLTGLLFDRGVFTTLVPATAP
jgi:hypothetical protein